MRNSDVVSGAQNITNKTHYHTHNLKKTQKWPSQRCDRRRRRAIELIFICFHTHFHFFFASFIYYFTLLYYTTLCLPHIYNVHATRSICENCIIFPITRNGRTVLFYSLTIEVTYKCLFSSYIILIFRNFHFNTCKKSIICKWFLINFSFFLNVGTFIGEISFNFL